MKVSVRKGEEGVSRRQHLALLGGLGVEYTAMSI